MSNYELGPGIDEKKNRNRLFQKHESLFHILNLSVLNFRNFLLVHAVSVSAKPGG